MYRNDKKPEQFRAMTSQNSKKRSERRQPQFQSPGNSSGENASGNYMHQEQRYQYKNRGKEKKTIDPEDLGFKRKLAISSTLPQRPGEGTLGKRLKLVSNCFPVKIPSGNVYHYNVSITQKGRYPESDAGTSRDKKYRCLSTKRNREVIVSLIRGNRVFDDTYAAYDGEKSLYTRFPLRAHFPIRCEVVLHDETHDVADLQNDKQDVFRVEIKPAVKKDNESSIISLDTIHALYDKKTSSVPQEAVMALETILRHGPCLRFTPIGRSFFCPSIDTLHPLGGGIEIWFGYHQSIRLGQWGPMVNLDLTATTFNQKGPVLTYIAEFLNTSVRDLRRSFLHITDIKKISNKLKNMRIEVTHMPYRRKYRILRLVKESANRLEFDLSVNGRTVKKTVAAYFRDNYNKTLDFPNLPCIQVAPENKKVYLPIEVCEILEGQHYKKKLGSRQTAEMIKFTARPPSDRFSKIEEIVELSDINNDPTVRGFDLEVSSEPLHLSGRVLDSPSVQYKDGKMIKPKDGSWNMRENQFLKGATIDAWVLLCLTRIEKRILEKFEDLLIKKGTEMGISMKRPMLTAIKDISKDDIKHILFEITRKYNAKFAVIIMPVDDKSLYAKIKQIAEIEIGLATQCIKVQNVTDPRKCTQQLLANLCQKINSKMGGENNALDPAEIPDIMKKPVIVIGADVNHVGGSGGIKPSLAACVGSLDMKLSRFAVSTRAQANSDENKKSVEIIKDLKEMVRELLKAFYRNTTKKPEKIIFYRDGVSEGQFEKVIEQEVRAVRLACRSLEESYEPGITFVLVQKRHHTRFMPKNPREGIGAMRNIPPGTTVDTVVSHPVNFDFFLCSHYGIKGTSRPAHYTVLEDDNNFTADDLQKLTYQLCHTYARCTRSISIPVPVAYADLAAYRARLHLDAALEESTASSNSSGSDIDPLSQSVKDAIKVINNTMYFV